MFLISPQPWSLKQGCHHGFARDENQLSWTYAFGCTGCMERNRSVNSDLTTVCNHDFFTVGQKVSALRVHIIQNRLTQHFLN